LFPFIEVLLFDVKGTPDNLAWLSNTESLYRFMLFVPLSYPKVYSGNKGLNVPSSSNIYLEASDSLTTTNILP
jgi:hypothetical protein